MYIYHKPQENRKRIIVEEETNQQLKCQTRPEFLYASYSHEIEPQKLRHLQETIRGPAIPNPNIKTRLENYQFYPKAGQNLASCTHRKLKETQKVNADYQTTGSI